MHPLCVLMVHPPRTVTFLLLPWLSLALGCAGTPTKSLAQAADERDLTSLKAHCKKVDVLAYAKTLGKPADQKAACREYERVQKLVAAETGECASIVETFESVFESDARFFERMAVRFAECERYDALFEHIALYGRSGEGADIIASVEAQGFPVRERWLSYLGTHQGANFLPHDTDEQMLYTGKHLAQWSRTFEDPGMCTLVGEAAMGAREPVILGMRPYLESAECEETTALAVSTLGAGFPDLRSWSCVTLTNRFHTESLPKMRELAANDPFCETKLEFEGGVPIEVTYCPVRGQCGRSATALEQANAVLEQHKARKAEAQE